MSQLNVDRIADKLAYMGALARRMPPAWDGAKVTQLASGPEGQVFGRMLPGRGLYLSRDLKTLGITTPLPYVYERTPLARAIEGLDAFGVTRGHVFDAERRAVRFLDALRVLSGQLVPACAITSYNGIINARGGGKGDDWTIVKNSFTTVALAWTSLFRAAGLPGAGAYTNIPTGATPNRASAGAWTLGTPSPTGGDKKYLLTFGWSCSVTDNMLLLVDLLAAAGNILLTSAAAQTVSTPALTRNTGGSGNLIIFEVTTQSSATAFNLTANKYTNQAGTTLQTTGAQTGGTGTAMIVQRLVPTDFGPFMNLAAGDYGVRSVQEVTSSAALVAGVIAINLFLPLAWVPGVAASTYVERDSTTQIDGLTELLLGSDSEIGCLTGYVMPNATTSGLINAFMRSCRG